MGSNRDPNETQTGTERVANGSHARALDETRQDKGSQATPRRDEPRRTNGKEIDEREWTNEQRHAAYIARQSKRTGVS